VKKNSRNLMMTKNVLIDMYSIDWGDERVAKIHLQMPKKILYLLGLTLLSTLKYTNGIYCCINNEILNESFCKL
jgi:hypothetical protein